MVSVKCKAYKAIVYSIKFSTRSRKGTFWRSTVKVVRLYARLAGLSQNGLFLWVIWKSGPSDSFEQSLNAVEAASMLALSMWGSDFPWIPPSPFYFLPFLVDCSYRFPVLSSAGINKSELRLSRHLAAPSILAFYDMLFVTKTSLCESFMTAAHLFFCLCMCMSR